MSKTDMEHQDQSSEPIATEQQDAKIQSKRKSPLELRRYTKQIWLAGLGAFSRAEEEGNKLFDSLVKVGEELEAKTVDIADNTAEKVGEVTGKAIERVTDTVDKVEKLIDQRTHHTLNRIGLVTPKDILLIEQLLLNLSDKVDQLANTNQKLIEEIEYLKKNKK
ncbi:phasin family protein [Acinetobacter populi]|jgi:poly(hydroxyalkanoate) granule-associated protein|uniref:phasin family protein n=1 Tax=Acinetobacter populi TaxID=1582270 RepID=UPI003B59DF36